MTKLVRSLALALCLSCSSSSVDDSGSATPAPATLHSSAITSVVLEVDYAPGAEPYTGAAGRIDDVWSLTRENFQRMFQATSKAVTVPGTLAEMEPISDAGSGPFDASAILALADRHRSRKSEGATATFYVVFLDGYFADEAGLRKDVLGVSIGRTGVLAMFKPVIASTEGALPGVARFVEQTTMVHELGHAVGLVDDGVVAVDPAHHDTAHVHHCTNERCAMNWSNEGVLSAVAFARQVVATGSTILLDEDCLRDLDAAATP